MNFYIDEQINQGTHHCRLGYIVIRNAKVQGTPPSLAQKFFQLQASIGASYQIDGFANIPLTGISSLYNRTNFDANKYNLASEELVRRVLHNKSVYYVNSAVTVTNYCSLHFLLSIGLYDLDQVQGDVVYRLPLENNYVNINGDVMDIENTPYLSDDCGIFGNPAADTRRTAVTLTTNNLLAVVYADDKMPEDELSNILNFISEMIVRYNGGIIEKQEIINS